VDLQVVVVAAAVMEEALHAHKEAMVDLQVVVVVVDQHHYRQAG
jgi:hypothetical protein